MKQKIDDKNKKNDTVNQYHLLAAPETLSKIDLENPAYRQEFNEKNKELRNHIKSFAKKGFLNSMDSQVSQKAFYLHDEKSMKLLASSLKDGDEVVLHGEGQPFVIGLNEPGYDVSPYGFAMLLASCGIPDKNIKMTLLSCNSATSFDDINFAKNTSKALSLLGYENIKVAGFTGFVSEKKNGKFSVSSILDEDTRHSKGTHASLEDSQMIYLNGEMIHKAKKILMNYDGYQFAKWADKYIKKAQEDKEAVIGRNNIIENTLKENEKKETNAPEILEQSGALGILSSKMGLFSKGSTTENIIGEKVINDNTLGSQSFDGRAIS